AAQVVEVHPPAGAGAIQAVGGEQHFAALVADVVGHHQVQIDVGVPPQHEVELPGQGGDQLLVGDRVRAAVHGGDLVGAVEAEGRAAAEQVADDVRFRPRAGELKRRIAHRLSERNRADDRI